MKKNILPFKNTDEYLQNPFIENILEEDIILKTGYPKIDEDGNISCERHGLKSKKCNSCQRIISQNTSQGGYRINEDKTICGICLPNMIPSKDIDSSFKRVKKQLNDIGFIIPTSSVNIVLSTDKELKKKNNTLQININSDLEGLAYTQYRVGVFGKKYQHTIYILRHITKQKFEGILAHELLHLWQNENDICLPDMQTEGLCNLGSYLIYKNSDTKIGHLWIKYLHKNPCPIYGDGYRFMLQLLHRYGWLNLIDKVLKNKRGLSN